MNEFDAESILIDVRAAMRRSTRASVLAALARVESRVARLLAEMDDERERERLAFEQEEDRPDGPREVARLGRLLSLYSEEE